jgi:hypothetical protein
MDAARMVLLHAACAPKVLARIAAPYKQGVDAAPTPDIII